MKIIIKKRIIFSLIAVIIYCLIIVKVWYKTDYLPVIIDVSANGKYKISVELNKKDEDTFKNVRKDSKTVYLRGRSKVLLKPTIKHPKRIKFIFKSLDNYVSDIYIQNIKLKNSEINLNDINKFSSENADLKIVNNAIILSTPPHKQNYNRVELIYNDSLNINSLSHIDFLALIMVFTLSFLIIYKFFDYIADFKTIQEKSRTDIFFILIFFVLLYVPMLNINKSITENTKKFPLLFSSKYNFNYNFGKQFNTAFEDRFFKKRSAIIFFSNLKYRLHKTYCELDAGYVYKDSGWMFMNQKEEFSNDILTPLSDRLMSQIINNIKILKEYASKNNFKVYIAVVPSKEYIYQEEDIYHPNYKRENVYTLVEKVKEELGYDIIYPAEEFRKLKQDEVLFYKTDHHLSNIGSYEFYKCIINRINKDFKDINITPLSEFNKFYNNLVRPVEYRTFEKGGNIERVQIDDDKTLLKYNYEYYDYKNLDSINVISNFPYGEHINPNGKYKMFIIGNSMIETLTYFLDTNFYEIVKYRFNSSLEKPPRREEMDMKGYEPFIEEEKPDILLIVLSAGFIPKLQYLYSNIL